MKNTLKNLMYVAVVFSTVQASVMWGAAETEETIIAKAMAGQLLGIKGQDIFKNYMERMIREGSVSKTDQKLQQKYQAMGYGYELDAALANEQKAESARLKTESTPITIKIEGDLTYEQLQAKLKSAFTAKRTTPTIKIEVQLALQNKIRTLITEQAKILNIQPMPAGTKITSLFMKYTFKGDTIEKEPEEFIKAKRTAEAAQVKSEQEAIFKKAQTEQIEKEREEFAQQIEKTAKTKKELNKLLKGLKTTNSENMILLSNLNTNKSEETITKTKADLAEYIDDIQEKLNTVLALTETD